MTASAARGHPEGRGVVTVCIPAFEAAEFIDRTLNCAREQTHEAQRILVSVDLCGDATEEICRGHASDDARVEVIAHRERLGWAGNVNFLLDQAESEFAFLYFHDDLISPEYSARLVATLRDFPEAASAHCDMGHFGGSDRVIPGCAYEGADAIRLLDFLTTSKKPSLLRSMLRRDAAGHVRLPTEAGGVWANQPFLMMVVAAGPVAHVPETLYRRWAKREGGLTDAWQSLPFEAIVDGYRTNTRVALEIIDGLQPSADERELLVFGLCIHMTLRLRQAESRYDSSLVHPPEVLAQEFAGIRVPAGLGTLPEQLKAQCEDAWERVQRRTAKLEQILGAAGRA